MHKICKECGFTLIELLVVVAIIAMLLGVAAPSLNQARRLARESVCMNNMRSSGLAAMLYANDYRYLPGSGRWFSALAPYLNHYIPLQEWQYNHQTMPGVLFCPEDRIPYPRPYMGQDIEATSWFVNGAETDFAMGHGIRIEFGLFGGRSRLEQIRSASQCMLLGETSNYGQAADVDDPAVQQALAGANASINAARTRFHHRSTSRFSHRGRMNIFYADGRVEPLAGIRVEPWPAQHWPGGFLMSPEKPFYPDLSLPTAAQSPRFWGPHYQGSQVAQNP